MPKPREDLVNNLALTDAGKANSTYNAPNYAVPEYQAQLYGGYAPYAASQYGGYADFVYDKYNQGKYDSEYKGSIDSALNTLQDRVNAGFQYDALSDPAYQQYERAYTRNGRNAMEDTMARQSSKTGGLASSYAISAAAQQYQNYMAALADKVPELRQLAYGEWTDTNNAYSNLANQYGNQDDRAYGQWKDYENQRYNIFLDEKNDAYNNYKFRRDVDYANWEAREAANKMNWNAGREDSIRNYNAFVDAYDRNYANQMNVYNDRLTQAREDAINAMVEERVRNATVGSGNIPTRDEIVNNSNYGRLQDALQHYYTQGDNNNVNTILSQLNEAVKYGEITSSQAKILKNMYGVVDR